MKNNYKFLLLVLISIYSCNSDDFEGDIITEEPIKNNIELKINGQSSHNRISGLSASVCCSKKLSISFDNLVDTENGNYYGGSGMNLELDKNGNLLSLWYQSFGPRKEYYSPFFYPTATLNVTDFEFIENEILKVSISGQIFRRSYKFYEEPETATIDAKIEIKDFHTCTCNTYSSNILNYNNFIFNGLTRTKQLNDISYHAYSINGYQLEFLNFNEYIRDMPLGVYEFDETSTSQRIDFRKFTGVPRAFISRVIPQEWLQYETSGSFEIIERQRIEGNLVSKVKFNLTAKHNDEVVFQFSDAILQTQM